MRYAILIFVFLAPAAFAAPKLPMQAVSDSKLHFEATRLDRLPDMLRNAFTASDEFTQERGVLPDTLPVCRIDLNDDGVPEYIVTSPHGYRGGSMKVVFQQRRNGFHEIATFQAGFYLATRANGYYQIVTNIGEKHGEQYAPHVLRYAHGEYKDISYP